MAIPEYERMRADYRARCDLLDEAYRMHLWGGFNVDHNRELEQRIREFRRRGLTDDEIQAEVQKQRLSK